MGLFDTIRGLLAGGQQTTTPSEGTDGEPPAFPYPLITVHGRDALATWKRLRAKGEGWPVVIGTDEDVAFVREGMTDIEKRGPDEILAAAASLSFPASLWDARAEDRRRDDAWLREQGLAIDVEDDEEPPVGDWPAQAGSSGFTMANDVVTGKPHGRVHIALLPCRTGWEAIAHLRWGNWNANPAPEYHVAALRSWNERFGAELVGCSHDVINLHVATRPATREAAMELAREQYLYCNDLVDQGTETFSALAATLMAYDWWYFWWD